MQRSRKTILIPAFCLVMSLLVSGCQSSASRDLYSGSSSGTSSSSEHVLYQGLVQY